MMSNDLKLHYQVNKLELNTVTDPTIGGPFHNFASVREIICCGPKFSLQCVILKHIKQHHCATVHIVPSLHLCTAHVKPAEMINYPCDSCSAEIIQDLVGIPDSKN